MKNHKLFFTSLVIILLSINNVFGQVVDSLQINKECEWYWKCPDSIFVNEVQEIGEIDFSNPTPTQCVILCRMAMGFANARDYKMALFGAFVALNNIDKIFGRQSEYYAANVFNILNTLYLSQDEDSVYAAFIEMSGLGPDYYHDPSLALIMLGHNILSLYENDNEKKSIVNSTKFILGDTRFRLGQYENALAYFEDAKNSYELTNDYGKACYAILKKALCYFQLGKYKESLMLMQESVRNATPILTDLELTYYWVNLAKIYYQIGEWEKSKELLYNTVATCERYNQMDINYGESVLYLALLDFQDGNYDECLRKAEKALNVIVSTNSNKSLQYADLLTMYSYLQRETGNLELSLEGYKEAAKIRKDKLGVTHHLYADISLELAKTYAKLGDNETAKTLGIESMLVTKDIYGEKHNKSAEILGLLSEYSSDPNQIAFYYRDAFRIKRNVVLKEFATMTLSEQKRYWEKEKEFIVEQSINAAYRSRTATAIETAYDAALLSKGLLLNSEKEFRELLNNSGSTEARNTFNRLSDLNKTIADENRKTMRDRTVNVDSLKYIRDSVEQSLVTLVSEFGDYTRNLVVSWKDIKKSLAKGELAIEFVNYNGQYAALVIGDKYPCPQMVLLCTQSQIDSVAKSDYYSTDAIYKLVWKTLQPYMSKAKKIYFSPIADFHKIAIEAIGSLFSSSKEFIRLTSTRQLFVKKNSGFNNKIILYGGMDYNMSTDDMAEAHANYSDTELPAMRSGGAGLRGVRFSNLPGTKLEVRNIDALIKNNKEYESSIFEGIQGTEESFYYTSKIIQPQILHIATHGFYWTENNVSELKSADKFKFLIGDESGAIIEDKAMSRTGLIFSGANNILQGVDVPVDVADGVLTAQEISKLDLNSCDLVVLSACQTGLGDISSEGVFGLQRGFKKAGVNSLMVSLWEVDDKATQLLMTSFYHQLVNGKSKISSLRHAQNVVKNTPGYSDPIYWAGFVLLDAIEKKTEIKNDSFYSIDIRNIMLNDSMNVWNRIVRYSLDVDYPIGNDRLTSRIQKYILDFLNPFSYDKFRMLRYAYHKDRNNLDLLPKHYKKLYNRYFSEMFKDDDIESEVLAQSEDIPFCDYKIKVEAIDDDLISFRTFMYQDLGWGQHGSYYSEGKTFFKSSAKTFSWESFQDTTSVELASIIEQALALQYFKQSVMDFREERAVYESSNSRFPLPFSDPYVTKEGVFFQYQPYEVSSYAEGAPECVVPIALLLPFLKTEFIR